MTFKEYDCRTKESVLSVLRYIRPSPSKLFTVIKQVEHCPYLEALDSRINCISETAVFPIGEEENGEKPHLSTAGVADFLELNNFSRSNAAWLFQNYIKLGFPLFHEISEHYLVWDSDAVLLQPYAPLLSDGTISLITTKMSKLSTSLYRDTYTQLVGEDTYTPPDTTFVVHQALFTQTYVNAFLRKIISYKSGSDTDICSSENLSDRECAQKLEWAWIATNATKGEKAFSEYLYLVSWELAHSPPQQKFAVGDYQDTLMFCRQPLRADPTICPRAYEALSGYKDEHVFGLTYVMYEMHESVALGGGGGEGNSNGNDNIVDTVRDFEEYQIDSYRLYEWSSMCRTM